MDVPTRVSLAPSMASVVAGSSTEPTVSLDFLPAPTGGTTIQLSATGTFGTVPMSVIIPEGQMSATITYSSMAMTMGLSTVTATLGSTVSQATSTNVLGTASVNHVVISEFAIGVTGSAADEFVELYNPTAAPVNIGGWVLQYRAEMGTAYQNNSSPSRWARCCPRAGTSS